LLFNRRGRRERGELIKEDRDGAWFKAVWRNLGTELGLKQFGEIWGRSFGYRNSLFSAFSSAANPQFSKVKSYCF
jgi:hypothetical protein